MKTHEDVNDNYYKGWAGNMTANFKSVQFRLSLCNRGFTLVELIVVCAILGILATMALPAISSLKDKAYISRAIAEIRGLEKDVIAYSTDAAKYPDSLVNIKRDKQRDPWGNLYIYYKIPDGGHTGAYPEYGGFWLNDDFDLYSMGADGKTAAAGDGIVAPPIINESSDDIVRGGSGAVVELGSHW